MKIITGSTKTTELLKEASSKDGYNLIVCHSPKEVTRLRGIIQRKRYKLPIPITYDEFLGAKYYGKGVDALFIDNV